MIKIRNWKQLTNETGIYAITSISTGKKLIGQTLQGFRTRAKQHYCALLNKKHDNPYLQNHINKYGLDDLVFELIEITTEVNSKEIYFTSAEWAMLLVFLHFVFP